MNGKILQFQGKKKVKKDHRENKALLFISITEWMMEKEQMLLVSVKCTTLIQTIRLTKKWKS